MVSSIPSGRSADVLSPVIDYPPMLVHLTPYYPDLHFPLALGLCSSEWFAQVCFSLPLVQLLLYDPTYPTSLNFIPMPLPRIAF